MKPLAIVTGANRGLGLEVSYELAQESFRVLLTARNFEDAEREATRAQQRGLDVTPHALDVTNADSMERFVAALGDQTVHTLVSNGAVMFNDFNDDVVAKTLAVNYYGATAIVRAIEAHFDRGTRVVMVSSGMGALGNFSSKVQRRFAPPISYRNVEQAVQEFVSLAHLDKHEASGWPSSAYSVSKCALNAWTRLYADEVRTRGILVNAVCPGWVRTRMGGEGAPTSIKDGAKGIVWAATLPPQGPTGRFFRDGRPIEW